MAGRFEYVLQQRGIVGNDERTPSPLARRRKDMGRQIERYGAIVGGNWTAVEKKL